MLIIRRDVMDIIDSLIILLILNNGLKGILNFSGSRWEGFCFWEFDFDMIIIFEN